MIHDLEYVTQFIIILNNRSNPVWQWTMLTYVKAENVYMDQKCGNMVYFPWLSDDFPGPRPNSMTFQAQKIWILNPGLTMIFQDLYAPCKMILTYCKSSKVRSFPCWSGGRLIFIIRITYDSWQVIKSSLDAGRLHSFHDVVKPALYWLSIFGVHIAAFSQLHRSKLRQPSAI